MKESYAPVREVKRVEIEIAGEGYKGKITGLRGELDFFSRQPLFQVWVDFEEPYPDPGLQKKLEDDPNFLEPLRGKNLACWCPLDRPCHVDVLLESL
jgi:hypothetical protein